jgi:hypothetical protein
MLNTASLTGAELVNKIRYCNPERGSVEVLHENEQYIDIKKVIIEQINL